MFRGSSYFGFIDNMGVLCALVLGASKELALSQIVQAAAIRTAVLRMAPWWKQVDSTANIADGGSRGGIQDENAYRFPYRSRFGSLLKTSF